MPGRVERKGLDWQKVVIDIELVGEKIAAGC